MYKYGEEISYNFELLKADDFESLQLFQCGNEPLDNHIRSGVIENGMRVFAQSGGNHSQCGGLTWWADHKNFAQSGGLEWWSSLVG